jgi:hypothetical protein
MTEHRAMSNVAAVTGVAAACLATLVVAAWVTPALSAAALAAPERSAPGSAAAAPDFSGHWVFNAGKSLNAGMMAALEIHVVIEQMAALLVVHEQSLFQGQKSAREVRYDLVGKPTANRSPMGDASETISRWDGRRLLTTWTSQGAIAGTTVVRTETRFLAADGTMHIESVRGSAPAVVMVYDRE